ncbi:hypothetical protein RJ639_000108 [Escallonia herrerae]|uniref:methylthioalkylmalate synthase n=1 Tax=Escallonia herrerae TaxID=1293975 RepID=A0AA88XBT3_9ASTE|nr:hypothetical protein RJ639_000108 [Escallonia herrerae]
MDSLATYLKPNVSFKIAKPSTTMFFFRCRPSIHVQVKSTCLATSIRRPLYIPNKISDKSYVRVLDTTLRDGEQAPGATLAPKEKLAIAHQLVKLGVDVIEAGFPVASKADFDAVRMIGKEVGNCVDEFGYTPAISAVARMVGKDIDVAWEAVKGAKHPRITIFIPTSEIHLKYKLNKTKEEVLRMVKEMIVTWRNGDRSEKEFLYQVFGEAIRAGATTIDCTDTVGCKYPTEWGEFIADMKANIPGAENVIVSTHCHNDLGLANANTLAAVNAGARQVEVTINGIGERAGNASFEEVEEYTGLFLQPHKAIVGANAFAHGSGIHQHGVLKHKATYEFISPEDIGLFRSNEHGIVIGKLSGRHALKSRLHELGHEIDENKFDDVFRRFKAVAERKKNVTDDDLELLVSDESYQPSVARKLVELQVPATVATKGTDGVATTHVTASRESNSISVLTESLVFVKEFTTTRGLILITSLNASLCHQKIELGRTNTFFEADAYA